jgi:hypothetical protein
MPPTGPPAPTVCPECGEPSTTNKWCLVCVPTSDDPPAPTAQWTVDRSVPADTRLPLWDGKAVIAGDVLTVAQERALVDVLVRRAGAAPDLTALDAVICRYHAGWRDQPQGGEIRWVREGYRPDVIRESQPMTAAENAAIRAALVRSAQNDTDDA